MRVRGLKLYAYFPLAHLLKVAPYAGAWIETSLPIITLSNSGVAPYAGAWIETSRCLRLPQGPWSHPMRVRGLKLGTDRFFAGPVHVAPYAGAWIETASLLS